MNENATPIGVCTNFTWNNQKHKKISQQSSLCVQRVANQISYERMT